MDTKQVVTIAVTAAVSTVTTLFVSKIFSLTSAVVATETMRGRVKKAFSKDNMTAALMLCSLAALVWLLVSALRRTNPITRSEVFSIAFIVASILNRVNGFMMAIAFRPIKRRPPLDPSAAAPRI